jgi:hypothetical protein
VRGRDVDEIYGPLIQRVSIIDAALTMGFTVTLDELTPGEFHALAMLRSAREEYRDQQARKEQAIAEAQRRSASSF